MTIPFFGPNTSLCCLLLSIWGVIMLGLLGIFYRIRSPALVDDLPYSQSAWEEVNYDYSYWEGLYEQVSTNCFIAAGIYAVTMVASFCLWRINERSNYSMS